MKWGIRSKNILVARYFSVNRLASKCIQRHGLTRLAPYRGLSDLRSSDPMPVSKQPELVFETYEIAKDFAQAPYPLAVYR